MSWFRPSRAAVRDRLDFRGVRKAADGAAALRLSALGVRRPSARAELYVGLPRHLAVCKPIVDDRLTITLRRLAGHATRHSTLRRRDESQAISDPGEPGVALPIQPGAPLVQQRFLRAIELAVVAPKLVTKGRVLHHGGQQLLLHPKLSVDAPQTHGATDDHEEPEYRRPHGPSRHTERCATVTHRQNEPQHGTLHSKIAHGGNIVGIGKETDKIVASWQSRHDLKNKTSLISTYREGFRRLSTLEA